MKAEAVREIVTPEGVPLRFRTALLSDRIGAFSLDAAAVLASTVAVVVIVLQLTLVVRGLAVALGLLAFFVIRCFYFTFFECAWQGSTPGKRVVGIRVVDAGGGVLTAEAVFARNLTREVELFLPLTAALAPEALLPEMPGWARHASLVWLFLMALLPLFNRDRLRVGDLVGGTLVVRSPRTRLRDDLSASAAPKPSELVFATEQLDLYGIRELHVLEALLRLPNTPRTTLEAVARTIREKTAWTAPLGARVDPERFLRAFYDAQRARLEQRLQLGERREAKRSGRLSRTP